MGGVVRTFCSAARYYDQRFLFGPRYMLWQYVFIFIGSTLAPGVPIARDDLVELLHQLPEPFLLVGDFNIHHPSWGDMVASPNTAMLLSVTLGFSLCRVNSDLPIHYHGSTNSFSCIDLSFRPVLSERSDHYPICFVRGSSFSYSFWFLLLEP